MSAPRVRYRAEHATTVHARCPSKLVWEYCDVVIVCREFIPRERLQEVCDSIRGTERTQESVCSSIKYGLGIKCYVTVTGRHGQNGKLVTTA